MTRKLRLFAALTAAAALSAAAGVVMAEAPPPAPAGGEAWRARHHERMEAKVHALHDLLNIKPEQDSAFHAFIAALRPPHPEGEHAPPPEGRAQGEHLTTPQRLDRMAAKMAERQAAFQARANATRQFYAVLSPEQQRAFDALPMLRIGGEFGGHPGGMRGGPGAEGRGWGGHGAPEGPPPPAPSGE